MGSCDFRDVVTRAHIHRPHLYSFRGVAYGQTISQRAAIWHCSILVATRNGFGTGITNVLVTGPSPLHNRNTNI